MILSPMSLTFVEEAKSIDSFFSKPIKEYEVI